MSGTGTGTEVGVGTGVKVESWTVCDAVLFEYSLRHSQKGKIKECYDAY